MAFTYGFYNSLNGDRKYNAFEMSKLFDGIICDGVFETIGQHFAVTASSGMTVNVGTGRAWFNHTWNENDSVMPITLPVSDLNRSRYDAVVIEVGDPNTDRTNRITVVSGTPAVNPVKPTLNRGASNNSGVSPDGNDTDPPYQHALAYILVKPGVESVGAADIEIVVGKDETPFVTGPIETRSIEELFNQWDAQFSTWFTNLQAQLTDNVVTNLQAQIDANRNSITTLQTKTSTLEAYYNHTKQSTETGTIFEVAPGYKDPITGALPCTGGFYSKTAYPALFNKIGYANGLSGNVSNIAEPSMISGAAYNNTGVDIVTGQIYMVYKVGNAVHVVRVSTSGVLENDTAVGNATSSSDKVSIFCANGVVVIFYVPTNSSWPTVYYSRDQGTTFSSLKSNFITYSDQYSVSSTPFGVLVRTTGSNLNENYAVLVTKKTTITLSSYLTTGSFFIEQSYNSPYIWAVYNGTILKRFSISSDHSSVSSVSNFTISSETTVNRRAMFFRMNNLDLFIPHQVYGYPGVDKGIAIYIASSNSTAVYKNKVHLPDRLFSPVPTNTQFLTYAELQDGSIAFITSFTISGSNSKVYWPIMVLSKDFTFSPFSINYTGSIDTYTPKYMKSNLIFPSEKLIVYDANIKFAAPYVEAGIYAPVSYIRT